MDKRDQALAEAFKAIDKKFGSGSIMKLGEKSSMNVEAIRSGSLALDAALGIGGYPKGRIIEIFGPESSGKTTIALHAIAEVQKNGGNAAFIDAEHALDPVYAKALGVDTDNLILSQPDNGEQALEIAETLIKSGAVDIIVIDSVAALVPKAEIEGEIGDAHVGLLARLMSQAMRMLSGAISKSNCVAVFINQIREKVGMSYGNPETTTGGRALKFYSSIRLEVRRSTQITKDSEVIGNETTLKVVKNKVAPPFRNCKVDIIYGQGISKIGEILDIAVEKNIVGKAGPWYSYNGEKLAQGRDKSIEVIRSNEALYKELETKVREKLVIK